MGESRIGVLREVGARRRVVHRRAACQVSVHSLQIDGMRRVDDLHAGASECVRRRSRSGAQRIPECVRARSWSSGEGMASGHEGGDLCGSPSTAEPG
ncbi:hypothetical protein ACFPN7_45610 [Amycolatopsis halotolerans]|uniref:hypothetical protein n=1 Tax=Amycolatopsis halotolerans TaxID=330083 RepID=UPI00361A4144